MKLAVLLYKFVPNAPAGIPGEMPAECRELQDNEDLPTPEWLWMTEAEFNAKKKANQVAMDTHIAQQEAIVAQQQALAAMLQNAKRFGSAMVTQTALDNIMLGITQAGKTRAVADYCQKLMNYLGTGSLYAAIEEIDAMIVDVNRPSLGLTPFITTEKLQAAKNKIKAYLGIP